MKNCNYCEHLNLTEEQQHKAGTDKPHICLKYGKRVFHRSTERGYHERWRGMIYLFSVAAGLVGGFAAVLLLSGRRPRRRREGKQNRRKTECSKLVLWAVLCTYFAGFGVGVWAVVLDASQLGVFLAYVGTPTATVIGFYSWKAKAENVVKIKKANPEETEGMPVDLNNVQP